MSVPAGVYAFPVVIVCAVLAWAGLEKIRTPSSLAITSHALGVSPRLAAIAAVTLPVAELAAVASVISGGSRYVPAALFVVLGTTFTAAGAKAIWSRTGISCACFGASKRKLGWPQVVVLPIWFLAAWSVIHMPSVDLRGRLESSAVAIVLLAAGRAFSAIHLGAAARSDRRAFAGG